MLSKILIIIFCCLMAYIDIKISLAILKLVFKLLLVVLDAVIRICLYIGRIPGKIKGLLDTAVFYFNRSRQMRRALKGYR